MTRSPLVLVVVIVLVVACSSGTAERAESAPAPSRPSDVGTAVASPAPASQLAARISPTGSQPDPAIDDLPSRVVIADLGIDPPIVAGDLVVKGNAPDYPLCDVAEYLTSFRFPGRTGTATWIYAHAREGMFLSMLTASEREDGAPLLGMQVDVYSTGGRVTSTGSTRSGGTPSIVRKDPASRRISGVWSSRPVKVHMARSRSSR
ncbi:MAG: hypothetical protein ABJC39_04870 [Chloroflexota bacterium]